MRRLDLALGVAALVLAVVSLCLAGCDDGSGRAGGSACGVSGDGGATVVGMGGTSVDGAGPGGGGARTVGTGGGGAGGSAPECPADADQPPIAAARAVVPWDPVVASTGGTSCAAGSVPGQGGAGGETMIRGCRIFGDDGDPRSADVICRGEAVVRAGSGGPDLVFKDDGSRLAWMSGREAQPPLAASEGDTVWVDYAWRMRSQICFPYCGSEYGWSIEIRQERDGTPIWLGGTGLLPVEADRINAMFGGISSRKDLVCEQRSRQVQCWMVDVRLNDHILETTPEQRIPAGRRKVVTTPRGQVDVFWSESDLWQLNRLPLCADGHDTVDDHAFAAALVGAQGQ